MKIVDDKNFESETSKGLVMVDFFATWCGPCRMFGMILQENLEEFESLAKIVKVDVDESPKTAKNFGILSIPTIVVLKEGKEVYKHIGLLSKNDLLNVLKSIN